MGGINTKAFRKAKGEETHTHTHTQEKSYVKLFQRGARTMLSSLATGFTFAICGDTNNPYTTMNFSVNTNNLTQRDTGRLPLIVSALH